MIKVKLKSKQPGTTFDFDQLNKVDTLYYCISTNFCYEESLITDIYLHPSTIQDINSLVQNSLQIKPIPEVGGFLLGAVDFNSETFTWKVVLEKFVSDHAAEFANPTKLVFGMEVFDKVDDIQQANHQLELVAWFHTHPGHSPFLSSVDLNTHNSFFPLPFQLALVLDPLTPNWDTGFFTRRKNGEVNNQEEYRGGEWIHWKQIMNSIEN